MRKLTELWRRIILIAITNLSLTGSFPRYQSDQTKFMQLMTHTLPPEGAAEDYESCLKQLGQVHDEVILEGPTESRNYISAGTATAPDADLYDPDQPLWANGQPMASPNLLVRVPSLVQVPISLKKLSGRISVCYRSITPNF